MRGFRWGGRCVAALILATMAMAGAGGAVHAADACKTFTTSGSNYPPVIYRDGDRYVGAAVDVVREAFERAGVALETTHVGPFKRVLMQARRGELDGLPGLYKTEERQQHFRYVAPIGPDPVAVFVRSDSGIQFTELADLKGHRGATRLGDSFGGDFDSYAEKHLNLSRHGKVTNIMKMLDAGRVDYVVFGYYAGLKAAREAGVSDGIAARTDTWVTNNPLWLVISKKSGCTGVADAVAEALRALRDDGAFQGAVERHMDALGGDG
ncbi:amino acid ABC transporter substrate-binding protein, PAAT family [Limimonas halophila]|uniref:Amino acid ABC transporter substrate-binding protein, PAAT family n=1 Tax=Limimonas halophila TaxID=1082479 RepID=A0A1G7UFR6_9PROT|nr:transporter substrate-binding domain-containing protein [Limimonas halophila]SDG46121.1 amino acid ABC transporter substrate-binding protein, PAAT family [Limimonas halophila]